MNLLIAILSNIYTIMTDASNSEYAVILFEKYKCKKWNKSYGVMMLLSPPFCILNLIIIPFLALNK